METAATASQLYQKVVQYTEDVFDPVTLQKMNEIIRKITLINSSLAMTGRQDRTIQFMEFPVDMTSLTLIDKDVGHIYRKGKEFAVKTMKMKNESENASKPKIAHLVNVFNSMYLQWLGIRSIPRAIAYDTRQLVMTLYGCSFDEFYHRDHTKQMKSMVPFFATKHLYHISIALKEMSLAGIVHGDIKTENCMIKSNPHSGRTEANIIDFEGIMFEKEKLASWVGTLDQATREMVNSLVDLNRANDRIFFVSEFGRLTYTPFSLAPEQNERSLTFDEMTDAYAFGIMMYEMLHPDLPLDDIENRRTQNMIDKMIRGIENEIKQLEGGTQTADVPVRIGLLRITLNCLMPKERRMSIITINDSLRTIIGNNGQNFNVFDQNEIMLYEETMKLIEPRS